MTSYSDNGYDVINSFCYFEKFLAYSLFIPSFIVVKCQIAEVSLDCIQNRVKGRFPGGGVLL